MIKKTITYTDYNDVERTETFYFNLSKAELAEMELGVDGGLTNQLKKIVDAKDTKQLITVFKDLVLKSYGIKSDDGRRFIKSDEISKAFSETEAYSVIFMQLATDDKIAAEFVNGIIPKDLEASLSSTASM